MKRFQKMLWLLVCCIASVSEAAEKPTLDKINGAYTTITGTFAE
jgi:hypothetical protein